MPALCAFRAITWLKLLKSGKPKPKPSTLLVEEPISCVLDILKIDHMPLSFKNWARIFSLVVLYNASLIRLKPVILSYAKYVTDSWSQKKKRAWVTCATCRESRREGADWQRRLSSSMSICWRIYAIYALLYSRDVSQIWKNDGKALGNHVGKGHALVTHGLLEVLRILDIGCFHHIKESGSLGPKKEVGMWSPCHRETQRISSAAPSFWQVS